MIKSNIQEILELLKQNFPKIKDKVLIKVIFTLKARNNQFQNIGFSRLECYKFGIGEDTLQRIIYFLRNFGIIEKTGTKFLKNKGFNCNLYKLSDNFVSLFNSLEFFTKKIFEYLDPIIFMKKFFSYKFRNGIYTFKSKGQKYLIQTRGEFKNVIYGTIENAIINPLTLL